MHFTNEKIGRAHGASASGANNLALPVVSRSELTNKDGFAVLTMMIIIGSTVFLIAVSLGLLAIAQSNMSMHMSLSAITFANTDGCMEEAFTRLNRNNSYVGETLTVGSTTCTISVTGSGTSRVISVSGTHGVYTRSLQAQVAVTPTFTVIGWQEN